MPKIKEVQRDRFVIHASVGRHQVGDVLAMFSEMGIQDVSYEFVTDIRTHHRNPAQSSASILDAFLSGLGSRKSFQTKEAVDFFKKEGATASAAYFALKKMVDTSQLAKVEEKTYAIAPKQLPAPTKPQQEAAAEAAPASGGKLSQLEKAIRFLKGRQSFHRSELRQETGLTSSNVGPIMTRLQELKHVKPTGQRGQYAVINSNHAH